MEIIKTLNGDELTIALKGELNSSTAPELEKLITASVKGLKKLIFDFAELEYISSAGLRILLVSKKVMDKQGSLIVRHCNESVMDIFEITGFKDILDIE
jgi:anti-sigma B factor antagonist